jgi:hypothetical protein
MLAKLVPVACWCSAVEVQAVATAVHSSLDLVLPPMVEVAWSFLQWAVAPVALVDQFKLLVDEALSLQEDL